MKRRKYLWSRFLLIIGAHGTTILTRLQNGNFNVHKCVNANATAITTTRTIANNCKCNFSQGVASTDVLHKLLRILWNDFPLGASDNLDYVLQWQIGEDFMEAGRFWGRQWWGNIGNIGNIGRFWRGQCWRLKSSASRFMVLQILSSHPNLNRQSLATLRGKYKMEAMWVAYSIKCELLSKFY